MVFVIRKSTTVMGKLMTKKEKGDLEELREIAAQMPGDDFEEEASAAAAEASRAKSHKLKLKPIDLTAAFLTPPQPLDFVLPGLLAGTVGVVVSPGGVGKSYLMLQAALSVGTGADVGGVWGSPPVRGRVVYLAAEDPQEVLVRRLYALAPMLDQVAREGGAAELVDILPAYGLGITIANQTVGGGVMPSMMWRSLEEHLEQARPRLLILDTLNRLLGGISENDSGAMGAVLSIIEQTCRKVGCAVVVVHHTNKASMSSGTGNEQHAARGSSAITDNARWQANLTTMSRDEADRRGIEDEAERRRWVRLDLAKVNYAPPVGERWLHRGVAGQLVAGELPAIAAKKNKSSRKSRREEADDVVAEIPF